MRYLTILVSLSIMLMAHSTTVEGRVKMIEEGKTVKFDYTLTVEGETVDTSEGKEPLQYVQGQGNIIPGLESQMIGLKEGDQKKVNVSAKDAYGEMNPELLQEVPKTILPPDVELKPGMMIPLQTKEGKPIPAVVSEIKEETIIFNFNHPLAGKDLVFDIKVVDIQ